MSGDDIEIIPVDGPGPEIGDFVDTDDDAPRGDFREDYERSGRLAAVTEAIRITRVDPRFAEDITAILDVAEYIRSGRRGLPIVGCERVH